MEMIVKMSCHQEMMMVLKIMMMLMVAMMMAVLIAQLMKVKLMK